MPPSFDEQARNVLFEAIKTLFPLQINPNTLIKQHAWRDRKYVGELNGRVVSWRGWSANLSSLDFRYRAIFVDRVPNVLPMEERIRLFGWHFARAISKYEEFVVLFVLDFPVDTYETILAEGFTPRLMSQVAHACILTEPGEFVTLSAHHWASQVVRLVMLQRILSRHRKPLDAHEIPLQHLLFRTGYLHQYIVKSGLGLIELEPPRSSGDFGHDLHAVVQHPKESNPFNLGVEVYMGAVGYHSYTIPQYIQKYDLRGIIVIAKDDPISVLKKTFADYGIQSAKAEKLTEVGTSPNVGIHYLPLQQIMVDLDYIRDDIDALLPRVPRQFGL
jgi:hypothetical protein